MKYKFVSALLLSAAIVIHGGEDLAGEYEEGVLLAKLNDNVSLQDPVLPSATGIRMLDSLNRVFRCSAIQRLVPESRGNTNSPLSRVYVFTFTTGFSIGRLIAAYKGSGLFEYVEPNFLTSANTSETGYFPGDPYFNRQWALHNDATFTMGGMFNPGTMRISTCPKPGRSRGETVLCLSPSSTPAAGWTTRNSRGGCGKTRGRYPATVSTTTGTATLTT